MALPTVAINSSGSNTAASGAGPATALSGTGAATAASTVVTLLVDNPDLSGVATDGSAVIYVGSSSGRQFAKITGVNNTAGVKTVTVANAFANTESGKNWGIGGKRLTLAGSTQLFKDMLAGWTIDVQTGPQTLTATMVWNVAGTAGSEMVLTSTAVTPPVITTATNSVVLFDTTNLTFAKIKNLAFTTTAGTKKQAFSPLSNGCSQITWENCTFDGFTIAIEGDNQVNWHIQFATLKNCEIKNCTSDGLRVASNLLVESCNIHDNAGNGLQFPSGSRSGAITIIDSTITSNGGKGINDIGWTGTNLGWTFCNNTVRNNTGIGFDMEGTGFLVLHTNNVYWGNGTNDVKFAAGQNTIMTTHNAYGTAGQSGLGAGTSDVTLSADPCVSSTDNTLNSTAGGGTSCKNAGALPKNGASTSTGRDLGAVPTGGGATGSTGFVVRKSINAGGAPSPVAAW